MDKETSEIAKLAGRISQDPKSKLFVPLAEEYKKAGDGEMAIHVLLEGLKNNPDYVTARSSLGKLLLEKGDMAGAQKEFEEVAKAIPDNLMAQKKLGDIYVIQNRTQDALRHYKNAFSLNPRDEELASLISDIESGRDVTSKTPLTKEKSTDAQAGAKQEPPASVSSARETASAPVSSVAETEEPEEVLFVEPLEPEPAMAGSDLMGEQSLEAVPAVAAEESPDVDIFAHSNDQDESAVSEDLRLGADLFTFEDTETIQQGVSELIAEGEIVDAAFREEITEKGPEVTLEEVPGPSDDFTTDTLAELYIAQGFFEKAIEIYERMLADNPDSRGLKDKLEGVRAAAAQPGTSSAGQINEPEAHVEQEKRGYASAAAAGDIEVEPSVFDELEWSGQKQGSEFDEVTPEIVPEAREYVPAVVPDEITTQVEDLASPGEDKPEEPSLTEDLFAESSEYKSAPEAEEHPATGETDRIDELTATPVVQDQNRPKPYNLDYEPREYIPPPAEQGSLKPAWEQVNDAAKAGIPGRREAIARLETWLTTIKKER